MIGTMKPTVYIETAIVSYLTARPSRDLIVAAHQQITVNWWENILPQVQGFISPFVIDEISKGDRDAAQKRIEAIANLQFLQSNDEISELAKKSLTALQITDKAKLDAFHLAIAAWHRMDYLVSWNCKHIVSARVRRIITEINGSEAIHTPVICTPETLMEI